MPYVLFVHHKLDSPCRFFDTPQQAFSVFKPSVPPGGEDEITCAAVVENPGWDYHTFNFDSDMAFADAKVGVLGNSTQLDLSAARNRGVKVIQYHGWNDQTLQPGYSPEYYSQVASVMGGVAATQSFYRLFMVPGMTHCYFGPGATSFGGVGQQIPPVRDATHDVQTALEA